MEALNYIFNWPIFLAALGIFGIYLAGKKNKLGWAVGVFAQLMWIIYAIVTKQYGFIISALAYGFVYYKNFASWKKTDDSLKKS
jgi:hypothetical protein